MPERVSALPKGFSEEYVIASGVHEGIEWFVYPAPLPGVNGYVRVPEGNPIRAMEDCYDLDLGAHGGITFGWFPAHDYSDLEKVTGIRIPESMKYRPARTGESVNWWIGFDTAHAGDLWHPESLGGINPHHPERWGKASSLEHLRFNLEMHKKFPSSWDTWWSVEKVIEKTKELAEQVAAFAMEEKSESRPGTRSQTSGS